jgi:hypothetical protein
MLVLIARLIVGVVVMLGLAALVSQSWDDNRRFRL